MSIVIDFSPADTQLIKARAAASNMSVEEFSHKTIMKAVHNAEYMEMIDRGLQQIADGTCHQHELIEEEP